MLRILSGKNIKDQKSKLDKIKARESRKRKSSEESKRRVQAKDPSVSSPKPIRVAPSVSSRGPSMHHR